MNLEGFEQGDVRQVVRFAWLPRKVNGKRIWFKKFMLIQKFMYTELTGNKGKWYTTEETIDFWH